MTLRKKTLLIVGSALIGLLVLLLSVSSTILLENFSQLEQKHLRQHMALLPELLFHELNLLTRETVASRDYFYWENNQLKPRPLERHFLKNILAQLNINILLVLDDQQNVIFNAYYDNIQEQLSGISKELIHYIQTNSLFTYQSPFPQLVNGVVFLSEDILMLAINPMTEGTVIIGRVFNEYEINRLNKITNLSVTLEAFNNPQLLADFFKLRQDSAANQPIVTYFDKQNINGYMLIKDIYQQSTILLKSSMPKEVYKQGVSSLRSLSNFVFVFAFIFALFILWLFERLVLARLASLNQQVTTIRTTGHLSTVTVAGNDELTQLADAINALLQALHNSHAKIKRSEASLSESQRIAHLGNWEWDLVQNTFDCSAEIYRIFGLQPYSVIPNQELFLKYVHPNDRRQVSNAINKTLQEGQPYRLEHRIIRHDGQQRIIYTQGEVLAHQQGHIIRVIGTLQDITETKQAQAETVRLLEENRFLIHRSMAIQEKERRDLARELHDEFGQCITAIQADTESILELARNPSTRHLEKINISAHAILSVSTHMYEVVHSLMRQLRPSGLDELGLIETLQDTIALWQARHSEVRCTFKATGDLHHLGETINISIYRIIQECLTNIAKYAQASQLTLTLCTDPITETLYLGIQDNGRGMNPNHHKRGLGLIGMRERVQALEGTWQLESNPGSGVKITITIPIAEPYLQKHRPWQKKSHSI
ncbi:MAG: PAS domain-containing protein [Pseudomonadota bacterium]|nr:PAS domain-containing protein [Pseudomonadota bacterium]